MPFMWTSDIYDVCTALNRHLCRCVSDIQNAVLSGSFWGCFMRNDSRWKVYVHLSLDSPSSIRRDIHELKLRSIQLSCLSLRVESGCGQSCLDCCNDYISWSMHVYKQLIAFKEDTFSWTVSTEFNKLLKYVEIISLFIHFPKNINTDKSRTMSTFHLSSHLYDLWGSGLKCSKM